VELSRNELDLQEKAEGELLDLARGIN